MLKLTIGQNLNKFSLPAEMTIIDSLHSIAIIFSNRNITDILQFTPRALSNNFTNHKIYIENKSPHNIKIHDNKT